MSNKKESFNACCAKSTCGAGRLEVWLPSLLYSFEAIQLESISRLQSGSNILLAYQMRSSIHPVFPSKQCYGSKEFVPKSLGVRVR